MRALQSKFSKWTLKIFQTWGARPVRRRWIRLCRNQLTKENKSQQQKCLYCVQNVLYDTQKNVTEIWGFFFNYSAIFREDRSKRMIRADFFRKLFAESCLAYVVLIVNSFKMKEKLEYAGSKVRIEFQLKGNVVNWKRWSKLLKVCVGGGALK